MNLVVKSNEKLIKFLIHNIQGLSFGNAQKMLRLGKVKVNSKRTKENISLNINDSIEIFLEKKSMPKVEILYKDENILIVNKPQGIECATRDKSSENTLSLEEIFADHNAIVVHRLDRLTEGLVILARNKDIAKKFERYFRLGKIFKSYKAYVYGCVKDSGIKTAYLKKDSNKSKVDISNTEKPDYKQIITEFYVDRQNDDYSLLDIKLHTGRTHQIRGYFSHLGHSVVGDSKYSKKEYKGDYKGYFLTAYKLEFNIDDELSYLNDVSLEITPSWLKYTEKI